MTHRTLKSWLLILPLLAISCIAARGETFPLTLTDGLGRVVTLKARPQRIISLTPSNTEILFAVGNGARIVGVTRFCDYPDAAKALPKIGGFAARTISIEAIVALKPDLVVAGDKSQLPVIEALETLGIPVIASAVTDFDSLYEAMRLHGRVAAREAEATALVANMRGRVEAVRERAARIPAGKRVRVYWETFDEPLMSAGPRGFVGQLIALSGGKNIFGDMREAYPHVSAEAVITRNPQVILGPALAPGHPEVSRERLLRRPGWANIEGVRAGRVILLPDNLLSRAGPRLVEGLELMAAALYPSYFGTGSGGTGILPVFCPHFFGTSLSSNPTGWKPVPPDPAKPPQTTR